MTIYDKETKFNEEIKPLVEKAAKLCILEGIPFFYTACVKNDNKESEYVSDGSLTGAHYIMLKDDRIKKHLLVSLGFDVIPEKNDIEIQMDDPDEM